MDLNIKENIKLSYLTTLKIGGTAKYFVEVKEKDELVESFEWAAKNKLGYFILSGGSNVLVNDNVLEALVIKISNSIINAKGDRLESGSGSSLSSVLSKSVSNNLAGLEWAVGIPGSIGGAIRGNAGAFGNSISDLVETVEIYNIEKKKFQTFSKNDCKFGYRESVFAKNKSLLIWGITLKLSQGDSNDINNLVKRYLDHRVETQPKLPSAGCIFKNLKIDDLRKWNSNLAKMAVDEDVVRNKLVPAGWLIEKLDFKGRKIGDIKVSLEHANFLVNSGHGLAGDFMKLANEIKEKAKKEYGVILDFEIDFLGF